HYAGSYSHLVRADPAPLAILPDGLLRFPLFPHAVPRHLHPFPTRRPSDLVTVEQPAGETLAGEPGEPSVAVRGRVIAARERAAEDRKSTRNSSHVKISYAVFCLKKKSLNCQREVRVRGPP